MVNHRVRRIVATVLAGVVASVVAEVTVIAAAATTSSAAAAFSLGLAALIATSVAIVAVSHWRRSRRQRRTGDDSYGRATLPIARSALIITIAMALSTTWALPRPVTPERAEHTMIERADGTRLAVSVTRADAPKKPPVIFVHGGPGVSDMAGDVAALAPMFSDRDLYVYDQIGAGASTRLPQVADYTLTRSIDDLAAVRAFTGADQVVLIGHSWGARIVTGYLAVHPETVAAAVLTAPGPPPVATRPLPTPDPASRLSTSERIGLYLTALGPRTLFTYALATAAPQVAPTIVADAEADHLFAQLYRRETPALFCDPSDAHLAGTDGVGFYSWLGSQEHGTDPRVTTESLASVSVPILVLRPECDYVPKIIAQEYPRLFTNTTFATVPGGHLAYIQHPGPWNDAVSIFLSNHSA